MPPRKGTSQQIELNPAPVESTPPESRDSFLPTGPGRILMLSKALERAEKTVRLRYAEAAGKTRVENDCLFVTFQVGPVVLELRMTFEPREGSKYLGPSVRTLLREGEVDLEGTEQLLGALTSIHRIERFLMRSFFGFDILAPKKLVDVSVVEPIQDQTYLRVNSEVAPEDVAVFIPLIPLRRIYTVDTGTLIQMVVSLRAPDLFVANRKYILLDCGARKILLSECKSLGKGKLQVTGNVQVLP